MFSSAIISLLHSESVLTNSEAKFCIVSDQELFQKINSIKNKVEGLVGIYCFEEIQGAPSWREILDLGQDDVITSDDGIFDDDLDDFDDDSDFSSGEMFDDYDDIDDFDDFEDDDE